MDSHTIATVLTHCMRTVLRARRISTALAAAALLTAATALTSVAALASTPIGPNQYFVGLVNGSTGRSGPVVIQMACFGAITPGQTGHPFAGQTVAVRHVAPSKRAGLTGQDTTSIGAFFGTLPPSGAGASSEINFTHYGTMAIPTSMTLPCAGAENVNFVPIPVTPAKDFSVPVTFVGQP